MPNFFPILWAAVILTILSIADMRAAWLTVDLTLAQAAWYPAIWQSPFRSRP